MSDINGPTEIIDDSGTPVQVLLLDTPVINILTVDGADNTLPVIS